MSASRNNNRRASRSYLVELALVGGGRSAFEAFVLPLPLFLNIADVKRVRFENNNRRTSRSFLVELALVAGGRSAS